MACRASLIRSAQFAVCRMLNTNPLRSMTASEARMVFAHTTRNVPGPPFMPPMPS